MPRRISQRVSNKPDLALVNRIIGEVSAKSGVSIDHILSSRRTHVALAARVECWNRIIEETQCSVYGLALVWGCDAQGIRRLRRSTGATTNIAEREAA